MYLHKTPTWLRWMFPNIIWRMDTVAKEIYLTFDDGPVADVTPWVLELLNQHNARATFFMVGENVQKHRELFAEVVAGRHAVANHTYNHLNGWQSANQDYLDNIERAEGIIGSNSTKLFRPPYGKLLWSQYTKVLKSYKIVMWDVLSGDFDSSLSKEKCLSKSINATRPGTIIVFHDSTKTLGKLKYVLPRYLEHFSALDYTFRTL
jgi:peptidoglycan-N-acetylglucosamine deacetylase